MARVRERQEEEAAAAAVAAAVAAKEKGEEASGSGSGSGATTTASTPNIFKVDGRRRRTGSKSRVGGGRQQQQQQQQQVSPPGGGTTTAALAPHTDLKQQQQRRDNLRTRSERRPALSQQQPRARGTSADLSSWNNDPKDGVAESSSESRPIEPRHRYDTYAPAAAGATPPARRFTSTSADPATSPSTGPGSGQDPSTPPQKRRKRGTSRGSRSGQSDLLRSGDASLDGMVRVSSTSTFRFLPDAREGSTSSDEGTVDAQCTPLLLSSLSRIVEDYVFSSLLGADCHPARRYLDRFEIEHYGAHCGAAAAMAAARERSLSLDFPSLPVSLERRMSVRPRLRPTIYVDCREVLVDVVGSVRVVLHQVAGGGGSGGGRGSSSGGSSGGGGLTTSLVIRELCLAQRYTRRTSDRLRKSIAVAKDQESGGVNQGGGEKKEEKHSTMLQMRLSTSSIDLTCTTTVPPPSTAAAGSTSAPASPVAGSTASWASPSPTSNTESLPLLSATVRNLTTSVRSHDELHIVHNTGVASGK